jgi:hypothetical protein
MRWLAAVCPWLGLALAGAVASACGTDAVGVSQCRTLEEARCRAGVACRLVDDLPACLRFTRDNCLHGTATLSAPKRTQVTQCQGVLEDAASCARDSRQMSAQDCGIDLTPGSGSANVCSVVLEPERALLCSFLIPEEEPEPPSNPDAGN